MWLQLRLPFNLQSPKRGALMESHARMAKAFWGAREVFWEMGF